MFKNHVVLEKMGISWTLGMCMGIAAAVLLGISAILFVVLFRHTKARARRLSKEEAAMVALYGRTGDIQPGPPPTIIGAYGTAGVAAELKIDIEGYREAARRGDWMTFWLFPIMGTCFPTSIGLAIAAPFIAWGDGEAFPVIMLLAFVGLFVGIVWFMPWAAIYTNIDRPTGGTATTSGAAGQPDLGSPRPPER